MLVEATCGGGEGGGDGLFLPSVVPNTNDIAKRYSVASEKKIDAIVGTGYIYHFFFKAQYDTYLGQQ